jgi:hypothetical protein
VKERALLAAIGGIFIVAIAAGCGAGTSTLSTSEYVSKLNAMCRDFAAREKKIGEPTSYNDLLDKEPRILDAFEKAIADKVGDLHAPPELASQADRLAEIANQQRDVLGGLVQAVKKGDLARVQALVARNAALNMKSSAIARRLGAEACS